MINLFCLIATALAMASPHETPDSAPGGHFGYNISVTPGRQVALDKYTKMWLKNTATMSVGAELTYNPQPEDNDPFARDYGYPQLAVGLKYDFNHGTTMHRKQEPPWQLIDEVDYDSHLGNALTLYGGFSRPFVSSANWKLSYVLRTGFSYSSHIYNTVNCIDNEFIGSHVSIYFGAALVASLRLSEHWNLLGGLEFRHHSNGALYRPNKGENALGPTIGIGYTPAPSSPHSRSYGNTGKHAQRDANSQQHVSSPLYLNLGVGVGAKTLNDEWQRTQFRTPPDAPDYRTDHFRVYAAYMAQADVMYRYARRWASGIGLDLLYGTYWKRERQLDEMDGEPNSPHSPWSVGVAAKHEAFWHNLSLAVSLGVYLHRQISEKAKVVETPYYERVGVRYRFPQWGGLTVGANVKAHKTKADLTEITIGFPISLK